VAKASTIVAVTCRCHQRNCLKFNAHVNYPLKCVLTLVRNRTLTKWLEQRGRFHRFCPTFPASVGLGVEITSPTTSWRPTSCRCQSPSRRQCPGSSQRSFHYFDSLYFSHLKVIFNTVKLSSVLASTSNVDCLLAIWNSIHKTFFFVTYEWATYARVLCSSVGLAHKHLTTERDI
jgi:hypothetical protein